MPPQIKQDLNRSGWETTDFPSVCENCLPDNPYVQMLKNDYGLECKICTRPFTVFNWKADRTSRTKRTNICLTCARLKNCCQCCMLDLSFGLPITIRDAALKMIAPGPTSDVNREYYAQEHEREIEEGRGGLEEYEKTDEKARDLLRRLANSEPYYKKRRRLEAEGETGAGGDGDLDDPSNRSSSALDPGPERKRITTGPGGSSTSLNKSSYVSPHKADSTAPAGASNRNRSSPYGNNNSSNTGKRRQAFPTTTALPPQPSDILPPQNPKITSLFLTGVEDDQPEHTIRTFFSRFGPLRSLVCSHRSHCAFVNYVERKDAEAAAQECQGRAVVAGVPLRVQWGRPKPLDSLDLEERSGYARAGRETDKAVKSQQQLQNPQSGSGQHGQREIASDGGGAGGGGGMIEDSELDEIARMTRLPPGAAAAAAASSKELASAAQRDRGGGEDDDDRARYASLAGAD